MSVLGELRRRKVFQIAAVYAVTAWLLIQVADTLLPAFGAPAWVFRAAVLALAMGFVVALILGWVYELTPEGLRATPDRAESGTNTSAAPGNRLNQITLALVVAAVAFLVVDQYVLRAGTTAGTAGTRPGVTGTAARPGVTRSTIKLPAGTALPIDEDPRIAIADDGQTIAFVAVSDSGATQLYSRDLDSFDATPLTGTENAKLPFFSPDGRWIGFWAEGVLQKVSVVGGVPVKIADKPLAYRGASWSPGGTIYLGGVNTGLERVPADGGSVERITTLVGPTEDYHAWPDITPDGRHLLFTVHRTGPEADWSVAVLSLASGEWRTIDGTGGGAQPHYVDSGHVVYARSGSLFAMSFDPVNAVSVEASVPLVDGVDAKMNAGLALTEFDLSRSGTLVFLPPSGNQDNIVMLDRDGTRVPLPFDQASHLFGLDVSPSGDQVAFTWNPAIVSGDIWVHDIARNARRRLTTDGSSIRPVWSPDGSTIAYSRFGGGSANLYSIPADQSAASAPLLEREHGQFPMAWTPDGEVLIFVEDHPDTARDIWALDAEGARPILVTPADESSIAISPDGNWIAFMSDASGQFEVYVQAFPGPGQRRAVSTSGGRFPVWSPRWSDAGGELFYVEGNRLMSVVVDVEAGLSSATPEPLFELMLTSETRDRPFDVMPSGDRFLAIESLRVPQTELRLVTGLAAGLDQLAPGGD